MDKLEVKVLEAFSRSAVLEVATNECYETCEAYTVKAYKGGINGTEVMNFTSFKNIISLYYDSYDAIDTVEVVKNNTEPCIVSINAKAESVELNVRQFGAKGDGVHDDTKAIQAAILSCPDNGLIYFPAGNYKVYPIFLKSNQTLYLEEGAVLSAYTDRRNFPILPGSISLEKQGNKDGEYLLGTWEGDPGDMFAGIITGIGVENVVISGKGVIDGNANKQNWWFMPKVKKMAWRPRMLFLKDCNNISVHGITVQNSPAWNIHPYFSNNLSFYDVSVLGPADSPNTDGLDPESCNNLKIIGCYFSVGDDCIAIKSGKMYMGMRYKTPSDNITIRQCHMRDGHGSITIGSEMAGGVKNVKVEKCRFTSTDRGLRIKTRRGRGEQAVVDGIWFDNLIMNDVKTPIVFNMYYFCDSDGHSEYVQSKEYHVVDERTPKLGKFRFSNIKAINCHAAASYMYGLPEQKIEEVEFDNVNISFSENAISFKPAMMDGSEETCKMGLFAKNVKKLVLKNFEIKGQTGEELITEGIDELIIQ